MPRTASRLASAWSLALALALPGCEREAQKPAAAPATRTLRVRLVDGNGNPVDAEGKVVWWAPEPDARFGTPVALVADGAVVLRDLPARPVVLVALPSGFVVPSEGWPRKIVPAGVTETDLVLDVGAKRSLRIHGWRKALDVTAYLAATTDLEPSQHGLDDDGTLRLEGLRPGVRYNLYVRERETDRCALRRGLAFEEPWPELELHRGRDLTGRVLFPKDCGDYASVAVMVDKAAMMDGQTNEGGVFTIRAVPPGPWTVVAYTTVGERYLAGTAEMAAGLTAVPDIRLR